MLENANKNVFGTYLACSDEDYFKNFKNILQYCLPLKNSVYITQK